MTKLSKAQVAILRRMDKGTRLEEHGQEARRWLTWEDEPYMRPCLQHNVLPKLLGMGLIIEMLGRDSMNTHDIFIYAITPAGRAYLEVVDDQP